MSENFTNTDELIRYLDGELQGENLDALRQKIADDPQLATDLENLRMAKAAVSSYGLKKTIGSIHTDMMQELKTAQAPPRIGMRRVLQYTSRIAAIFVLVLGATALYQYFSATPEKLFRDGYETFSLHETRGNGSSQLEEAYKKGDFAAATAAFSKLTAPRPTDYFLNANAALANNDIASAIASFVSLQEENKQNSTHFYEEDTNYYLGLAYLRNDELLKALPIFEEIHADPGHPYHSKISGWWLRKLQRLAHNK